MGSNAARKYEEEETPKRATQVTPANQPVRWNRFERLLMVVGSAITLLLIITLLSTKISINTRQHDLQDLQAKITQVKNNNASDQQEIAELTSQSNLKRAAHKYGLTDKNSNVRNVNR
ncbi:septum formation initiator family protein [Limosilactobacillus viscerum]|uniref:septum formation initiator family protein n=1 Tax=Limosilactobacillus viscerum TaxID=2993450 RepID=UPI0024BA3E18|nr:septum formation initiator family protein [Limosilactobacillus viscerum]